MVHSLSRTLTKLGIAPRGALHLGAHLGQEAESYAQCGFGRVVWVEGDPRIFERLREKIASRPGHEAYNVLLSDSDHQVVEFNVASNDGAASSILEFDTELLASSFPELEVRERVRLSTRRLDSYLVEQGVSVADLNFLNIDLQGAELIALRGMGALIDGFDLICSEINLARLYKSSALLHELDEFLADRGFRRASLSVLGIQGQAYYVRDATLRDSVLRRAAMVGSARALEQLYRVGLVDFLLHTRRDAFPYSAARFVYRSIFKRERT